MTKITGDTHNKEVNSVQDDRNEFHKLHKILAHLNGNIENITAWLNPRFDKASSSFSQGFEKTVPRIQESLSNVSPKINNAIGHAGPKIHDHLDGIFPAFSKNKEKLVNEYLPHAAEKFSHQAHRFKEDAGQSEFLASLVTEVRTNRRALSRKMKKLAKAANQAVRETERQMRREAEENGRSDRGKNWLLALSVLAVVLVGLWKVSQPVNDGDTNKNLGTKENKWENKWKIPHVETKDDV